MIIVALSALFALAAVVAAVDPVYERAYIGAFINSPSGPPPAGYTLMSLADMKTPAFIEYYNNRGIDFVQPFPSGYLCCIVLTTSGYLAYGPSSNLSYLEPFQGATDCCTTGYMPNRTTFGGGPINGEPMYYQPIPQLNASTLAQLSATPGAPPIGNECSQAAAYTAIFKLNPPPASASEYKLQQIGPDYPPLSGGWEQASLQDVKSGDFAAYYNKHKGLQITQSETANYCCMIQVAEGGWLMYGSTPGRSPLSTYEPATMMWNCSIVNSTIDFYTTFGGDYTNIFFPLWNGSVTAHLSLLYSDKPSDFDGCIGLNNTLALIKRTAGPVPPPPPTPAPSSPSGKHAYKVQQVGPNYPAPQGWTMASLADVKGADFAQFYNANGIQLTQSETTNYCCMIQVSDGGWLMYGSTPGRSPLTTFNMNGGWQCNVVNIKLYFATYFGGNYMNTMFTQWNTTVSAQVSLLTTNTQNFDGCIGLNNTLALWRQPLS